MKKNLFTFLSSLSIFSLVPAFAFAVTTPKDFTELVKLITDYVNLVIPLIIGVAVVAFLWGVLSYIMSAGNEEKRGEALKFISAGLVGLFVMVTVWGLVNILVGSFGLSSQIPTLNSQGAPK